MNNNRPFITVITVVFDGVGYIERTIQSVISKRKLFNIQYLIIDGGSTDGTMDIINEYLDQIDFVASEKDRGIYDAMNKGLGLAEGVWVNFMNAGDILVDVPDLSKLDDYVLVYGCARLFKKKRLKVKKHLSFDDFSGGMAVCHQACFYKTAILQKIKYDTSYKICGDQKATAEILKLGDAKYIDHVVVDYDYTGVSTRSLAKIFMEKLRLNKEIGFPLLPVFMFTLRDFVVKLREIFRLNI